MAPASTYHETIVVVGSGNIAQYLAEEFTNDKTYNLAIVSRTRRDFFLNLPDDTSSFHQLESYTTPAIVSLLDSLSPPATALISTLQGADPVLYTTVHSVLLQACRESRTCKRFVSSEYMGNLRNFPEMPRGNYYARQPFRSMLAQEQQRRQQQSDGAVTCTSVNQGWLADYWIQPADGSKSYMRPFPEGWPIDLEGKTVRITGDGESPIGWTAARDMAKAVVKLMRYDDWPDHVFVYGELGTWNDAIGQYERFLGHKLERIHKTPEEMYEDLSQVADRARWYTATMDEWSYLGGTAVPPHEALAQREKYFKDVHFRTLDEIFSDSKKDLVL